jgi:hypothetical protein
LLDRRLGAGQPICRVGCVFGAQRSVNLIANS